MAHNYFVTFKPVLYDRQRKQAQEHPSIWSVIPKFKENMIDLALDNFSTSGIFNIMVYPAHGSKMTIQIVSRDAIPTNRIVEVFSGFKRETTYVRSTVRDVAVDHLKCGKYTVKDRFRTA